MVCFIILYPTMNFTFFLFIILEEILIHFLSNSILFGTDMHHFKKSIQQATKLRRAQAIFHDRFE